MSTFNWVLQVVVLYVVRWLVNETMKTLFPMYSKNVYKNKLFFLFKSYEEKLKILSSKKCFFRVGEEKTKNILLKS